MQCEPAITTTQCHPEEGNFVSKVFAARWGGDEKREEGRILAIRRSRPPRHTCGLFFSSRHRRSRLRRKLFRPTFNVDRHNRAQSTRMKRKILPRRTVLSFRNAPVGWFIWYWQKENYEKKILSLSRIRLYKILNYYINWQYIFFALNYYFM